MGLSVITPVCGMSMGCSTGSRYEMFMRRSRTAGSQPSNQRCASL